MAINASRKSSDRIYLQAEEVSRARPIVSIEATSSATPSLFYRDWGTQDVDPIMDYTDAALLVYSKDAANARIVQYSCIAGAVLLIYDTLLTLSEEIKFVWMRRIRISAALYLMGRYAIILALIFSFALSQEMILLKACNGLQYTAGILTAFGSIGIHGVLILTLGHTWKLYRKEKVRCQMSLIDLLIYQGIIRFSTIFVWIITAIIISLTVGPSLTRVLEPLEQASVPSFLKIEIILTEF
ncbi:hypothetical protein M422DRAFT_774773 [Sphaerobolus stellatus SS14]|nr:hypothetical protein M422DRAFT_774773 [Sphaerobolus stellatus SS14]